MQAQVKREVMELMQDDQIIQWRSVGFSPGSVDISGAAELLQRICPTLWAVNSAAASSRTDMTEEDITKPVELDAHQTRAVCIAFLTLLSATTQREHSPTN